MFMKKEGIIVDVSNISIASFLTFTLQQLSSLRCFDFVDSGMLKSENKNCEDFLAGDVFSVLNAIC